MKRDSPGKRAILIALTALLAGCGSSGGAGGAAPANAKVTIVFWHGQSGPAQKELDALAAEFHRAHPNITVESSSGGTTTDGMLQKVTTAIAAGTYPDIAYLYGSWAANIGRSPKVLDLSSQVKDPAFGWSDFWPALRSAATVNGKVIGIPAAAGDLGVFYSRKMFAKLGIPAPAPDWTWDDFRAIAKRCTSASAGNYGVAYPGDASEDTTWRFWPMLWQLGGSILSDDGTKVTFDSPQGVQALTVLQQMATTDRSVYVDVTNTKGEQLFLGGHMCMYVSGPWALLDMQTAHFAYGEQVMPGFGGNHATVAGADNWVIFDHGSARSRAAVMFARWLTAPAQDVRYDLVTGSLPLRKGTTETALYAQFLKKWSGIDLFARLLPGAQSRPALIAYPQISQDIATAIVAVLLGRAQPQQALAGAAQKADQTLAIPG